jgi:activator of HSP90 ATPase
MKTSFKISTVLPSPRERLYKAWLSSKEHSVFTGGKARIQARVGGRFTAWDGYITGTTVVLEPFRRVVQSWRTAEFPPGSPDSRLEVLFDDVKMGTRVTLIHRQLPQGQAEQYKAGWREYYFVPMREYYSRPTQR